MGLLGLLKSLTGGWLLQHCRDTSLLDLVGACRSAAGRQDRRRRRRHPSRSRTLSFRFDGLLNVRQNLALIGFDPG
jgi:hypothetical protein